MLANVEEIQVWEYITGTSIHKCLAITANANTGSMSSQAISICTKTPRRSSIMTFVCTDRFQTGMQCSHSVSMASPFTSMFVKAPIS